MNDQTIITAEVVSEKLIAYAAKTDLSPAATETLVAAFAPVFSKCRAALNAAQGIAESVKDATCVTEIRKSRECRLALRTVRIEGEKIHKAQKENALRYGRAVDGFRNILLADIAPVELALENAERTAERAEAARKAAIKAAREAEILPLSLVGIPDLGEMPEAEYAAMLADAKLLRQAKIDAAAKAEAERLAREKADREERARIIAENARIRAEAIEAARKAEVERLRLEVERAKERRAAEEQAAKARAEADAAKRKADAEAARLRAELAAKAKAEAAAKAKAEAEEAKRKAAERKAANAPDKQKLEIFAAAIRSMSLPDLKDDYLRTGLRGEVNLLANWCESKAADL